jgi:hypothetical protein
MFSPFFLMVVLPTLIGILAIGSGAVWRQRELRRKKAAELARVAVIAKQLTAGIPEGSIEVFQGRLSISKDLKTGTTMLVGNGSVGCLRVVDCLIALARIGSEASVGSILLHECDARIRGRINGRIPEVYRDRLIWAFAQDFPEGFGNLPPKEVEKLYGRWSVSLKEAIERAAKLHEKRNDAKPGQVTLFTSLGGHAFPGVTMTEEIHTRFPDARIVGIVNLPRKEEQRDYFLTLKEQYEHAGIIGWVVSDRMEQDNVTQDSVISDIVTGYEAASIASDGAIRLNNVVTGISGFMGGGVACFEYIYGDVVAHTFQPDPHQPPKYYVYPQQVISELRNLIEKTESGKAKVSLDMPVARGKRQTYDLVLAAVAPRDMLDIRDYIERAREEDDTQLADRDRPHLHAGANYEPVYASWSQPIDSKEPRCQVCVIRLRPVDNSDNVLLEMVKIPRNRRPQDTTTQYEPALPLNMNGSDEEW